MVSSTVLKLYLVYSLHIMVPEKCHTEFDSLSKLGKDNKRPTE